jgi:uncharacterized coiled-coil protein SlyX
MSPGWPLGCGRRSTEASRLKLPTVSCLRRLILIPMPSKQVWPRNGAVRTRGCSRVSVISHAPVTCPLKTSRRKAVSLGTVAFGVVMLVVGAAFAFYFITSSGTIQSQSSQISSQVSEISYQVAQIAGQQSQISSQSSEVSVQSAQISSQSGKIENQSAQIANQVAQITGDNMQITNLTSRVSLLDSQISSLQSEVAADQAQIQSLSVGYGTANQTIASLDSQIAALNSQVASLNGQIATLNNEIAEDQGQISTLQAEVSTLQSVLGLTSSAKEFSGQYFLSITQNVVKVFNATYSGYVAVAVTAASDYHNEGANVHIGFAAIVNANGSTGMYIPGPSSNQFYVFPSVPGTLIFPVTPGTITVYLDTLDTGVSATVTVTYYY